MEDEKYVFLAEMDVDPAVEDLFNEVYDDEHIPEILALPGVKAIERYEAISGEPKYLALYEFDRPDVRDDPSFQEAADKGRWPGEVRPFTHNRRHRVFKLRQRWEE